MKEEIAELAQAYWKQRLPDLEALAARRSHQIENLLILEQHQRTGRQGASLYKALGAFGAEALELGSLSASLSGGAEGPTMQKERFGRIRTVSQDLEQLRQSLQQHPPGCTFVEMAQGLEAIAETFAGHIAPLAKIFRTLRLAEVEAGASYDPEYHQHFFEKFDWRQLDNEEMALCPPLVVFAPEGKNPAAEFTALLQLLTAGKPFKVVLLRTGLENLGAETGREAALKATLDPELLFLSLRNVFFCQGSSAGSTPLKERLAAVLRSPRPAVFSVYAPNGRPRGGSDPAALALASRAVPHLVYDPDRAPDFVSCLDLSENPAPEAAWASGSLKHLAEDGQEAELVRPLTFADFALGEPALHAEFTPLAPNGDEGGWLPLWEFLALPPQGRRGKTPFVHTVDQQKHLVRLTPSQSMVARAANKMHLWRTLQELCGIENPFVRAAEQGAVERLSSEKEASLTQQKAELEARISAREQEAVGAAMKNLALRLTGAAPPPQPATPAGTAPLQTAPTAQASESPSLPAPAAPAETPAAEPPVAEPSVAEPPVKISAEPWVETRLCTTCDECIAINKKIFAYNAQKKAIIKDARGGPFRDIVRAAEKCSSGAIHPGQPLDPNEKDLEKWIKRAEPFQ